MPLSQSRPKFPATNALFPPTRDSALAKLEHFIPFAGEHYRLERNFDYGSGKHNSVSQLSPYIRNGTISESEVVASVLKSHPYHEAEKFLQEVFWRIYWKGYLDNRPALWTNYLEDLSELNLDASQAKTHQQARNGATGIDSFDTWSEELQQTGYLHNHARMWFASIWIFTLKLPWQLGAAFFLEHLLDGDPASNTLGWRWVAGLHTKGKSYLARPSNITRYTQGRFQPAGGLAAEAISIPDSHPAIPASYKKRPAPPQGLQQGEGLLMLDEDLRPHLEGLDEKSHILGMYPQNDYSQLPCSEPVRVFRETSLRNTLQDLSERKSCCVEVTTHPSSEAIETWAQKYGLHTLWLAQPQIGPWNDLWSEIEPRLAKSGLQILKFRPWWENELFPSATHGFFKFHKGIKPVATRMANATS
ncbi:hypothetical protein IEN85_18815 [Pelagicoccus sp. NFK12]|uniref:Cryptochrome/DNA photolyase FAD-binding domain-containing protein n=1 Tax=Pelagicoccus enzymogenes TaxID=2773457 RepID=A0A927IIS4_9BACT|nr:FAD-binding domain-containing protein [Pelagicoccus enzymogenes]MBD5781561.1 hypothetical protein [Pelagicoccus enzymogenes]